jgi:outer membrane protein assembly factor BamB
MTVSQTMSQIISLKRSPQKGRPLHSRLPAAGLMLVGALALAGCSNGAPSLPGLDALTDRFRSEEPKVPGTRREILPQSSTALAPSGKPVVLPPAIAAAEWPNPGGTADSAPGHRAGTGAGVAFSTRIGEGSSRRQRLSAPPIVHAGYVVGMDSEGQVAAISLNSGGRGWSFATRPEGERGPAASGGGVAASDGLVFVASPYGTLTALSISSGQQVWQSKMSAPARGAPTTAGGRVYVVSATNVVHAYESGTGTEAWQYSGIPSEAGILSNASPSVSGNRVVVPYTSGEIIGFDAVEGAPVWSDQLSGTSNFSAVSGIRDVAARPIMADGIVYAVGVAGRMIAVRAENGERLWGTNIAAASTPAIGGNSLFVVTLDDKLMAVDREDGSVRWTTDLPDEANWVGPLLAGNALWVGGSGGQLLRLDPNTGSTLSANTLQKGILIPPIAAGGRVLVLDDSGTLTAFN